MKNLLAETDLLQKQEQILRSAQDDTLFVIPKKRFHSVIPRSGLRDEESAFDSGFSTARSLAFARDDKSRYLPSGDEGSQ